MTLNPNELEVTFRVNTADTPDPCTDVKLTTAEAAASLGLAETTLWSWRYRGKGPRYVAVDGRFSYYRRQDLESWKAENITLIDPSAGADDPEKAQCADSEPPEA